MKCKKNICHYSQQKWTQYKRKHTYIVGCIKSVLIWHQQAPLMAIYRRTVCRNVCMYVCKTFNVHFSMLQHGLDGFPENATPPYCTQPRDSRSGKFRYWGTCFFYGRMPFLTPTLSGVCQEPGITERWQNNTTQDVHCPWHVLVSLSGGKTTQLRIQQPSIAQRIARTQNKQNNISKPPTPHDYIINT